MIQLLEEYWRYGWGRIKSSGGVFMAAKYDREFKLEATG